MMQKSCPWLIEEHVPCWYHHWTLGGSRGTHWLRNLVPQTITEVDPGTNQTLGPTFNDAEILPWVIEEHVPCWYHHWDPRGQQGDTLVTKIWSLRPSPKWILAQTTHWAQLSMMQKSSLG